MLKFMFQKKIKLWYFTMFYILLFHMPNLEESKNILYIPLYNWMKIEVSCSQLELHTKRSDNARHIFRYDYPFIWIKAPLQQNAKWQAKL